MIEILPIKLLRDEDSPIFGSLNIYLGKLARFGLPVAPGFVVTPPILKLRTVLESYDFSSKEMLEQSLTLVKKELTAISIPEILFREAGKHNIFFLKGKVIPSVKDLWVGLLDIWIDQIKQRFWNQGFYEGITVSLEPQVVIVISKGKGLFHKKIESFGSAYFDPILDDSVINIKKGPLRGISKLHPNDLKILDELIKAANKKLLIPHEYEWILDGGIKLTKVLPYTPTLVTASPEGAWQSHIKIASSQTPHNDEKRSVVKVFLDLSQGQVVEKDIDGVYISSEKVFDLNKPKDSFEDLVLRVMEAATTFEDLPILFKLADKSEGMGKIRGALRLLHQQSLFQPMVDALDFLRHKKGLTNVHIVVPFIRGVNEFLQIKRELAAKKLTRKNSLQLWLEVAVPENIINLEDYLVAGLDGIVLNLDELVSFLNGFDKSEGELIAYKNEVKGLLSFLEDALKLLNKSRIPFIATGSLCLYPQVLEFLVEKGVYGLVVESYEAHSAYDLLYQAEKRLILRRSV